MWFCCVDFVGPTSHAQRPRAKCKPCPQRHAWSVRTSATDLGPAVIPLNIAFSPCGSAVGRGVHETGDDFPCADGQRIPRWPCTRCVCPIPCLRSSILKSVVLDGLTGTFVPKLPRVDRWALLCTCVCPLAHVCARTCVYFEWRARSRAISPSFRKSSPMWHWWAACSSSPAVLLPSYTSTDLTQPAVTCVKFKWHFCGKKYETLQKSDVQWIVEVSLALAPLELP